MNFSRIFKVEKMVSVTIFLLFFSDSAHLKAQGSNKIVKNVFLSLAWVFHFNFRDENCGKQTIIQGFDKF